MIRRYARQRREYLYRKSLEGKEKQEYERKQKLRKALAEGKEIPTELQGDLDYLSKQIQLEDENTQKVHDMVDDEYANAGVEDPTVFITTSRNPSARLAQFAKEMRLVIPNAQRMNRGGHTISEIINTCKAKGVTDIIVAHETRGQPDGLIVCHLPFGPTAFFGLSNCVLRHDIEGVAPLSLAYPHLIFNNFSSKLGERTTNILKYLFPVPKDESKRVITFSNDNDFVSFRHHMFEKDGRKVELEEVGPRFEMKLYQIRLGTLDQEEADVEWALRPFMRTSRKRHA
eukprot:CAMPEP_0117040172 /NCGR_PEP_ID=MMETSP0472-20121206/28134_1 /TAXON_ID=693140 ORGANISM="Tiarina fusus, Strain LIS" /NCGR_SAMPLE_ID=MMETSP0472 /ASSEMBLY_ACC=CAM_ASM_000603 /LENGTH=285 /DNA_ID=CAMNT_0004750839 /DNA_START=16 /DNA_END=869 /DNA_ORIENTATION=+